MFKLRGRTSLYMILVVTAISATFSLHPAMAEDWKEPPRKFLDPLGLDMADVSFPRDDTFLVIGDPAAGGLAWTYHAHDSKVEGDYRGYIGTNCTDPPPIFSDPTCDGSLNYIPIWIGQSATLFEPTSSTTYDNWSGTGATLSLSGSTYIYTESDGTIYTIGSGGLTSIKHPNGVLITVNYALGNVVSVGSNTGFAFRFLGSGSNGTVYAINMLAHGCSDPLTCATDSSIVLSGNPGAGYTFQINDPAGQPWKYSVAKKFHYTDAGSGELLQGPRTLWAFLDPTGYGYSITRSTKGLPTGFVDPRGTFVYTFSPSNLDLSTAYPGSLKDPSGAVIYTAYLNEGPGLASDYADGAGRHTTYSVAEYDHGYSTMTGLPIAPYSRLTGVTYPEGDYVTYSYDTRGNITSVVKTGKWGSGLSESVTSSYPSTCTNPVTCNKPTWTKDAKGNETDYTYDATHGGVLTVVLPIDQNGLREKTFNIYTTYNTGDGNIYRLTRSETCGLTATQLSTLTACPTTTSTSVTATDYGTSTTAPNTYKSFMPYSVTQTDGASSLSATTSYTYDIIGNVIAVNGPRTDVDDTSYKTYDANRRLVCEIGVDPDGAGALVRVMTRHVYDDAGRQLETDSGTGTSTSDCTPGTGMTVAMKTLVTYDAAGRAVTTRSVSVP